MNMTWIDWAIMFVAVIALRLISLSTRQYMRGVADFLSANRSSGRYLLTIAGQMGNTAVIAFVGAFEMGYQAGLTPSWWGLMGIPVSMIILLTGWVFYRFRETRAMTLAQFFEMRYSRRFRIYAGILCWSSGVLNFGIFPAVAARFFMYFCGLPDYFHLPGVPLDLPTFATIMAVNMALALMFVNMGGQVSVMVTECAQGIFCTVAFIVISVAILVKLQWTQIIEALNMAPANASMIHPFHTSAMPDFGVSYFLIAVFGSVYTYMSWQGTSGFNSAARTPHEQKMGGIIGIWRCFPQGVMTILLALSAYAILHLPEYSAKAAAINNALQQIDSETIRGQMMVPVAMAKFLPVGIKGLLATVMLFASFTCHDTYMHSWGTIFIQDVVMPIRNKALDPDQHIRWLRWSIIGVGAFSFFFSLLYPQTQKILMYQAITGTIWLGGSGSAIIGGLYWRRGTTAAAYASLTTGAVLGVAGLILPTIYKSFPINGQWMWLMAMVTSGLVYVVVSLMTGRTAFDLEHMLHRGKCRDSDHVVAAEAPPSKWLQIVGITKDFSFSDRILAISLLVWNSGWFTFFVGVSIVNVLLKVSTEWWAGFWHYYLLLMLYMSVPVAIWFGIGGVLDIKALFRTLATATRDHTDDGRVLHKPKSGQEQVEVAPAEDALVDEIPSEVR